MNTAPTHLGDAQGLLPRNAGNVHRQHAIQLYTDEHSLLDLLDRYAGKALTSGNAVIVLATQFHLNTLHRRLIAQGFDPEKAESSGCYVPIDAEKTLHKLMVNHVIDERRFRAVILEALRKGRASVERGFDVMVFGELVALLWTAGKRDEAARVERLWNEIAMNQSFSLLCAYPVQGFTSASDIELFARVCGEHSVVIPTDDFLMLGSESARLRNVAQLQQRAIALEGELASRQRDEQFRLLVEAVQDYAIFMLDPDGIVVSWNLGAERIKQYRPDEIIGKPFSCFYPPDEVRKGKPKQALQTAADGGRFADEGWRVRKDGFQILGIRDSYVPARRIGQIIWFRQSYARYVGAKTNSARSAQGNC